MKSIASNNRFGRNGGRNNHMIVFSVSVTNCPMFSSIATMGRNQAPMTFRHKLTAEPY